MEVSSKMQNPLSEQLFRVTVSPCNNCMTATLFCRCVNCRRTTKYCRLQTAGNIILSNVKNASEQLTLRPATSAELSEENLTKDKDNLSQKTLKLHIMHYIPTNLKHNNVNFLKLKL